MSRKLILMAVASSFGLLAVWYVALWSPQSASLNQAKAGVTTAIAKEKDLKTQVAVLQKKRLKLPAMQAQLAQVSRSVPLTADVDKLIDDVNAAAVSSGVSLLSFSPAVQAGAGGAGTPGAAAITISTTVTGSYFQIVNFINQLNAMPRLAVIDSFTMGTPDKDGKMNVTISGRVFMVAPPAPKTPTTPTTATSTKGGK